VKGAFTFFNKCLASDSEIYLFIYLFIDNFAVLELGQLFAEVISAFPCNFAFHPLLSQKYLLIIPRDPSRIMYGYYLSVL